MPKPLEDDLFADSPSVQLGPRDQLILEITDELYGLEIEYHCLDKRLAEFRVLAVTNSIDFDELRATSGLCGERREVPADYG